ncbi:MAG: glycosyltransferase family 2 protein [Muribaculaceae bacterium]|nr:glycosyltransferase family 2 protein [Muribaculaceae bacterium]
MKHNLHTFVILAYQESPYLEQCIKSVINQSVASSIIIATTTPNEYITKLAAKYQLKTVTGVHTNIGGDFDFALHSGKTPLVTIAHQDDIYDKDYAKKVITTHQEHLDSSIIFTNYYEIRNNKKIYTNLNLKIKRLLLFPFLFKRHIKSKFVKRLILRFGDPICCPSVTFVTKNCPAHVFSSHFKCNVDWHAWETLSKNRHSFSYLKEPLIGHRISDESTTTDIINQGIRTKEDYEIFQRFWPKWIAKILTKIYRISEKSNSTN